MEPQAVYTYLVAARLTLDAVYGRVATYEAYPKRWKVAASASTALVLAALAIYLVTRL